MTKCSGQFSDVAKAKINLKAKAKAEASTIKAKARTFEDKAMDPETKAVKHTARAEFDICSTSHSRTG